MNSKHIAVGQMLCIKNPNDNVPLPTHRIWKKYGITFPVPNSMPEDQFMDYPCEVVGHYLDVALIKTSYWGEDRYFVIFVSGLETCKIPVGTQVQLIEKFVSNDEFKNCKWFQEFKDVTGIVVDSSDRESLVE